MKSSFLSGKLDLSAEKCVTLRIRFDRRRAEICRARWRN